MAQERLQFSVGNLMGVVLVLAIALAALRSDSSLCADAIFTLDLGLLCTAIVGVWSRRGRPRAFWLGFALFGWVYLVAAFEPQRSSNVYYDRRSQFWPRLVTTDLLDYLNERRVPLGTGSKVEAQWSSGNYYAATIMQAKDGKYFLTWQDGSTPSWVARNQVRNDAEQFRRLGHSLLIPLVAFFGGGVARYFFGFTGAVSNSSTPPGTRSPPGAS